MKNIKKTYLLMILLLSLSVPGYACYPETIDDWSTWCEDNGISYNEYDTYEDYLANATDEQLDNWDGITNGHDAYGNMTGSIDNIYITAPIVNNNTNTSTVDPSTPFSDPDPDYDNNTPDPNPNDCAGVEGGSAYFDNCRECVGGTTGKEPCDCEGDKCPICGGLVVIESLSDLGLMKVAAADSKCRKCTCLRNYSKLHECDAYADMYKDALANKNEYCALLTTRGVHSWKTESPKEGEGFGPFSPKWDNTKHLWYIGSADNKEYIVGVAHVHWEEFEENFSGTGGDFSFAQTLHGAPLFLFNAQGEVKACFSPDGISCGYIPEFPSKYTIKSITDCSQSLLNYCSK